MKHLFTFLLFYSSLCCVAQKVILCDSLKPDSCFIPLLKEKQAVQIKETIIKNEYQIQFIKYGQKNYLKIIVKDNLGFGKTGSLVLLSNKKQYYLKSIKLEVIDKNSGYFILDLNTNYLTTIRQNGLTTLIFQDKAEFVIPKTDSDLIKKSANCFYESLTKK